MSTIDRIRYYDGEFLRAFDFGDEQTYHMEMRRRLNRYLHHSGIVHGLKMITPSGSADVTINPGFAIDAFGREIYVFAPYTLGDSDVTANRITTAGTYDVWLCYRESPGTPPTAGYGNCNQTNQYTRWVESFSISLLSSPSSPFKKPRFADSDTDDPAQDHVGVLLGTVYADPTANTTFTSPLFDAKRCTLIGMIAQTIQIPTPWGVTKDSPPFSFLNASGIANIPLSSPASLEIMPNVFADQNLIVGSDFVLTTSGATNVNIQPKPTGNGSSGGNVKIAGDLFVQGNIYNLMPSSPGAGPTPVVPPASGTNSWLGMSSYVASLVQQGMPDFVASQPQQVMVPTPVPNPSNLIRVTAPAIVIPSKLSAMGSVVASASISGIQLNPNVTFGSSLGIIINSVQGSPGASQCSVSVTYTVTGDLVGGTLPPILSFSLTATAVCFPKTTP